MPKSVREILEKFSVDILKLSQNDDLNPCQDRYQAILNGIFKQALSDIKKLLPKSKLGLIANREIGYSDGWNAYKKEIERILDV